MDNRRVAELQVVLEGVKLPATRDELIAYARRWDADAGTQLARLPKRSFDSLDDVAEELMPTQPNRVRPVKLPAPESGLPPGGVDYVNPQPQSGEVHLTAPEDNPASKAIEQQSRTQKRQAAVQQGKPLPGPLTTT
jgi:hypothetical protein